MLKYNIIICLLLVVQIVKGQVNFETAESLSGIIGTDFIGLDVGYSFSSSKANITLSRNESMGDRFSGKSLRLTIPVVDGSRQLFGSGKFNPGASIAYDYSWSTNEFDRNRTYYFFRLGYEISENRFGFIDTDEMIQIEERITQKIGLGLGANFISTHILGEKLSTLDKDFAKDNLIIAGFVSFDYHINPVMGLTTREFVFEENTATNGVIQQTINAFSTEQEDFFSITPKIDFVWTPIGKKYINTAETFNRVGILSSLSAQYNTQTNTNAWNFSIGPSLHPKNKSSKVIAALLAEFSDFSESTNSKDFDDIFSINLYVGIPVSFNN